MKTIKTMLITATALGMLAGVAVANDLNSTAINQEDGENNVIAIDQDREAGATGENIAGTDAQPLTQNGDNNLIDIDQHNDGSLANEISDRLEGVDQIDNGNVLTITQNGGGLKVHQVQQDGGDQTSGISNTVDIDQDGSRHRINEVNQTFTGGSGDAQNTVHIKQTGALQTIGSTNSDNGKRGITQTGTGNAVTVDQSGRYNKVDTVNQDNSGSGGGTNIANITQVDGGNGNGNTIGLIDQTNTGGSDNIVTTHQSGTDNRLVELTQIGSGNDANATQSGSNNELTLLKQNGTGNMATTLQNSSDNVASIDVAGNHNTTDISQFGMDGSASITILSNPGSSDHNEVFITQESSGTGDVASVGIEMGATHNFVDITQNGDNDATVDIIKGDENEVTIDQIGTNVADIEIGISTGSGGDGNVLNVIQRGGSGDANTMAVAISGSFNNSAAATPRNTTNDSGNFSGKAADLIAATRTLDSTDSGGNIDLTGFRQSDLFQDGTGNEMNLTITSNLNSFAMLQDGESNLIDGTIGGGGNNQAVVVQLGDHNSATFTQNGTGNIIAISQGGGATFP